MFPPKMRSQKMVPCLGFASWVEANNSQHSSKQFVGQAELACCPRPSTGDTVAVPFPTQPGKPVSSLHLACEHNTFLCYYLLLLWVWEFELHISLCILEVRRGQIPWDRNYIQTPVSCLADAKIQTWVLYKNSQCSWPLSHLSSPHRAFLTHMGSSSSSS